MLPQSFSSSRIISPYPFLWGQAEVMAAVRAGLGRMSEPAAVQAPVSQHSAPYVLQLEVEVLAFSRLTLSMAKISGREAGRQLLTVKAKRS